MCFAWSVSAGIISTVTSCGFRQSLESLFKVFVSSLSFRSQYYSINTPQVPERNTVKALSNLDIDGVGS